MNSNQLSESLLSCKNSATIPTLLRLHKAATLLDPPWACWKQRGRCEWATLNATPSGQIGRFSQNQLHLWLFFPIFHNLPSLLWRSTVSPSFQWIYLHHTECRDLTLNTKYSADVVASAPLRDAAGKATQACCCVALAACGRTWLWRKRTRKLNPISRELYSLFI